MGFMTAYKRLEKLCGEVMGDKRGVTAYIDEMVRTPRGCRYVSGWDRDLKSLKHYRWVRNQIVHEPGCGEENLCEPRDALWLENFYERIMTQTDPLALCRKATLQPVSSVEKPVQPPVWHDAVRSPRSRREAGCLMYLLAGIAAVFLLLI